MIPDEIYSFLCRCNVKNIEMVIEKCEEFKNLLVEENSKYNLTNIVTDFDFWNKHVADSASIGIFFDISSKNLVIADIGCGGGFPSIVLSIAYPNLKIYAIDSIGKKTAFVAIVKERLGIGNLKVITARSNELKFTEPIDIITARAVAIPDKILKDTKHLITMQRTNYILYQTPKIKEEIASLNKVQSRFKLTWNCTDNFNIPGGESRTFLFSTFKHPPSGSEL